MTAQEKKSRSSEYILNIVTELIGLAVLATVSYIFLRTNLHTTQHFLMLVVLLADLGYILRAILMLHWSFVGWLEYRADQELMKDYEAYVSAHPLSPDEIDHLRECLKPPQMKKQ